MVKKEWGRIINISSVAGLMGAAMQPSYGATKAALIGLSNSLAIEGGRYGITVNAVCPGFIATEAVKLYDERMTERIAKRTALKRMGRPEEVAQVVAFWPPMRELGISKQAASELVDTLVVRGYMQREANPDDRRRVTLEVTERGRAAAAAVKAGVAAVDKELAGLLAPTELAGLRAGLVALCAIRERIEDELCAAADGPVDG